MRKGVFVIASMKGGGAQRVVSNVVNYLVNQDWEIYLLTIEYPGPSFYSLDKKVKTINIDGYSNVSLILSFFGLLGRFINCAFRLRKTLNQINPDVAISFITLTNIQLIMAAIGNRKMNVIISERSDPVKQKVKFIIKVARSILYRRANFITANSKGVLKYYSNFLPQSKLYFIPNPIKIPKNIASRDHCLILQVGSIKAIKAQDLTLRAFSMIYNDNPEWRLRFVGDGTSFSEMQQLAKTLKIDERVDWIGSTQNVDSEYAEAGIFVMPSRFEGMPNALLEAMSHGLPCIVSDASPGLLELIENEQTGLVVPVNNHEKLAEAMLRLIRNKVLRNQLGMTAREKVMEFEENKVMRIWEDLLSRSH